MKPYLAFLFGTMASNVHAEECLDRLVVDVEVRNDGTLLSTVFHDASLEERRQIADDLLTQTRKLYGEMGITVELGYVGGLRDEDVPGHVRVIYADADFIVSELFPTPEAYLEYVKRNNPSSVNKVRRDIERKGLTREQFSGQVTDIFERTAGYSDPKRHRVYVSPLLEEGYQMLAEPTWDIDGLEGVLPYIGEAVAHELAHNLGIQHSKRVRLGKGVRNLMAEYNPWEEMENGIVSDVGFRRKDRDYILAQVCGEEK